MRVSFAKLFHVFLQYIDQASVNTANEISIAKLQQVLDKNSEGFFRYVPVDAILPILEKHKILDDRDVTDIRNKQHKQDKIELLFKIFKEHRRGIDLKTFCQLLQEQGVSAIQKFGQKMEMELTQSRS